MVSPLMETIASMVRTEPRGSGVQRHPVRGPPAGMVPNGEPFMTADVPGSP